MTRYTYTAVPVGRGVGASLGAAVTGNREAIDERELRDALRAQGLVAVTVRPSSIADALGSAFARDRLKRSDSLWFFATLSFMLGSNVPVEEAVSTMEGLSPSPRLARALSDVRDDIRGGVDLSEAVSRRERLAPTRYIALLRVGERSGQLARVADLIRRSMETSEEIRRQLVSSLIYPALLLSSAVLVLWGLGVFVIPRFAEQLTQMGGSLPWQTAFTLALADVLVWLVPALVLAAILAAASWRAVVPATARAAAAERLLTLPVVGSMVWHREAAVVTETMATMLEGGADALESLERAADVATHPAVRERLESARSDAREGADLAEALRDRRAFPKMITAVISVGMRSGDLGPAFRRASELCVEKQRTTSQRLMTLVEPALIVVMAGSVLWVVYSLVTGMLAMTEAAR